MFVRRKATDFFFFFSIYSFKPLLHIFKPPSFLVKYSLTWVGRGAHWFCIWGFNCLAFTSAIALWAEYTVCVIYFTYIFSLAQNSDLLFAIGVQDVCAS